ncbi:MAG: TlpA family protein disulfide reductase [Betaproteobacteria bacterium]|nr:TlpA family protein disulfide reductase [Betaproteobacteria bacterium]
MKTSRRRLLLFGLAVITAAAGGFGVQQWLRARGVGSKRATGMSTLLALNLPDATGKPQPVSQWRGRLLLINFWATWCAPCREEVPALIRSQQAYAAKNLQTVGISIDSADKVAEFAAKLKINYPLLIAGLESIDLVRELGNPAGALPYSVLISPDSEFLASHLGGMNDQTLAAFLRPYLKA